MTYDTATALWDKIEDEKKRRYREPVDQTCLFCHKTNPPGRLGYCSDKCSEASRAELRERRLKASGP